MVWNFASIDGRTKLTLEAGNAQSNGFLTRGGKRSLAIGTNLTDTVKEVQLSVGGQGAIKLDVSGDSVSPTSLRLTGTDESGAIDELLVPMMNRSIEDIVDAYRRSYAVFTISEEAGVTRCIRAIKGGPTLNVRDGVTGLTGNVGFDYDVPRNLTFPDNVRNGVCQDVGGDGSVTLTIPGLTTEAGTPGPVMIQFVGAHDHFSEPPFKEPHDHIKNVFYEDYKRQCLTVEYENSGGTETLNFNHGHARSHRSVIIRPSAL
jgi:hypothetical protein